MVTQARKAERQSRTVNRMRAREMRHTPAATEKLFWQEVRNRKLDGFKFKRQVLVGPYIADFACIVCKLIVELDGKLHDGRIGYDRARDAFLQRNGWRVFRLKNELFAGDPASVLLAIRRELEAAPSPQPSPPHCGGEGGTSKLP